MAQKYGWGLWVGNDGRCAIEFGELRVYDATYLRLEPSIHMVWGAGQGGGHRFGAFRVDEHGLYTVGDAWNVYQLMRKVGAAMVKLLPEDRREWAKPENVLGIMTDPEQVIDALVAAGYQQVAYDPRIDHHVLVEDLLPPEWVAWALDTSRYMSTKCPGGKEPARDEAEAQDKLLDHFVETVKNYGGYDDEFAAWLQAGRPVRRATHCDPPEYYYVEARKVWLPKDVSTTLFWPEEESEEAVA